MLRVHVNLDDKQYRRLKRLAAQSSKSISQLVREGIDALLASSSRDEPWKRLWSAVGSCHDPDAASDVSEKHDRYLDAGRQHE